MAERKHLVDCPNCQQKVIAEEHADDTPFPFLRKGPDQPTWRYILATCEICWHALVLRQLIMEDEEKHTKQIIEVLWPSPERVLSSTIPGRLRREHAEARACFRAKAFIATVVMVRRTLEGVCSDHEITKKPLYAALDEMKSRGLIEGRLLEWAQGLRVLGNDGAHFTGKRVSQADAEDALALAEAILDYLYVFSAQFDAFKERRRKKEDGQVEEAADDEEAQPDHGYSDEPPF